MRKSYVLPLLACAALGATIAQAEARNLVGVAIAGDDRVYYWYSDNGGEVSIGVTDDPFRHRAPQYFEMVTDPWTFAAVGINSQDRVYYWWTQSNGSILLTVGTSQNPQAYGQSFEFTEPEGYILLEAGIASDDRVYYYWRSSDNGLIYNTVGTSTYPTASRGFRAVEGAIFMQSYLLLHVDIASDDHVYYYWRRNSDGELFVTSGTSIDPFAYRDVYPANQPD